ncbi:MAG: deoxyribonuclease IV [Candidatus Spechtbacterales bacterium]
MKNKKPLLGAHVSVAGGVQNGILRAENIGAQVIQIHASSPRQWTAKAQKKENIDKYKELLREGKVEAVFLHAPYLINIASKDSVMIKKSTDALDGQIRLAEDLNAHGVVVHMGSVGMGNGKEGAAERAAGVIKDVLVKNPGAAYIILENSSGGGGKFGATAAEIGEVVKRVASDRVRICIDTAHAFGSGELEFSTAGVRHFFETYEKEAGKDKIALMHINDSKAEFGSFKDRHENIGDGLIGIEGFKILAQDKSAIKVPWVLEVPGIEGGGPDSENMRRIQSIFVK